MDDLYLSPAVPVCFDGDDPPAGDVPPAADDPPTDDDPPAADDPPAGSDPPAGKTFTQDEVNEFLARDRRKHKERMQRLERQLEELSQNSTLSDDQRQELESSLEDLRKQLRTKQQQAKHDRERLEREHKGQLDEALKRAEDAERKFRSSMISRSLKDAAVEGDAFNPDQVVTLLVGQSKLTDANGTDEVVVEWLSRNDAGEEETLALSPSDAIKRMKETPERFGNLFKANVVGGIGANSATGGLAPGKDGKVDLRKLAANPEAYRKARKEHPELFN